MGVWSNQRTACGEREADVRAPLTAVARWTRRLAPALLAAVLVAACEDTRGDVLRRDAIASDDHVAGGDTGHTDDRAKVDAIENDGSDGSVDVEEADGDVGLDVTPDVEATDGAEIDAPSDMAPGADVRADADGGVDTAPEACVRAGMDGSVEAGSAPGTCTLALAGTLRLPSDRVTGTLAGPSRVASRFCPTESDGPEHSYALHLEERTGVQIAVRFPTSPLPRVIIRRACDDPASEVLCYDDNERPVLEPGDYFVILDAPSSVPVPAEYTLEFRSFSPPSNANCATPLRLEPDAPITGSSLGVGAGSYRDIPCTLSTAPYPQLFYSVTIPSGQRASLFADSRRFTVFDGCEACACLARGTDYPTDLNRRYVASVINSGTTPRTVTVAAESRAYFEEIGIPGLQVYFSAPPPGFPASNAVCARATRVTPGVPIIGENTALAAEQRRCDAESSEVDHGPTLYYVTTIPAGRTVQVVVTGSRPGTEHYGFSLLDGGCGSSSSQRGRARTRGRDPAGIGTGAGSG